MKGENTFTLRADGGTCDAQGAAYALTDAPVKAAHPMEMEKADIAAWKGWFAENNIAQPFEQIGERVIAPDTVGKGRYDGITVPTAWLGAQAEHGIVWDDYAGVSLSDCYAYAHTSDVGAELRDFEVIEYTRRANHVMALLDEVTLPMRVANDDMCIADLLDGCDEARITELIDIANEHKAHNVMALLLDYKHKHFEKKDPLVELTFDV